MAQFIVNPRRAPRAPARCRAVVVTSSAAFDSETEDIGSHGCQLVAPRHIRKGDAVQLTVTNEKVADPLRITGRVAWVSPQAPWRVGVAFDEGSVREGTRWFDKLISAYPGMAGFRRVPESIPVETMVYLGAPPRFLRDFSEGEAMLLRAIASGVRIDELQARLHDRWPAAQRALFSLIARQAVTLSRGQAVHPDTWKPILMEVEASLAIESLGRASEPLMTPPPAPRSAPVTPLPRVTTFVPTPAAAAAAAASVEAQRTGATPTPEPWISAPVQDPSRMIELPDDGEPPLELAVLPRHDSSTTLRAIDAAVPLADSAGASHPGSGGEWSPSGRARNADAQAAYDGARAEIAAGNFVGALALLRRALRLAPGDPEISEALGRLTFKERGR